MDKSLRANLHLGAFSRASLFCIGGKGEATHFETDNSAFLKINAITQVSQGILSTIVVKSKTYFKKSSSKSN